VGPVVARSDAGVLLAQDDNDLISAAEVSFERGEKSEEEKT
jgi:hypothetical protein